MNKYHVFYTWAYGMDHRQHEFDSQEDVLKLVEKAKKPDSPYLGFTVIYGEKLKFKPVEVVKAWAIDEETIE